MPLLTDRQTDVVRLAAEGLTNAQIGEALWIGHATVKSHLRGAFRTLGAQTRDQAVVAAYRAGVIR